MSKKTSLLSWFKKEEKDKNELKDLALKLHVDGWLRFRLSMQYYLHLAIEGGSLELLPYLKEEIEENDGIRETIESIRKFNSSKKLSDKMKAIKLQLAFLDFVLRAAAMPWLRAGDNHAYAKICNGWEGLYSKSKSLVYDVEDIINLDESESGVSQRFIDKSALFKNLRNFLIVVTFKYGLLIMDISFREKDVRPAHIAIIPQVGRGGIPGYEDPIGAELWRRRRPEPT